MKAMSLESNRGLPATLASFIKCSRPGLANFRMQLRPWWTMILFSSSNGTTSQTVPIAASEIALNRKFRNRSGSFGLPVRPVHNAHANLKATPAPHNPAKG